MCFRLPAWKTLRSSPTGCPPLCSALILWRVSPPIQVCCLQKRGRPSSPVRTLTSPACPPSSLLTKATVEPSPHTDTAQVTVITCFHCILPAVPSNQSFLRCSSLRSPTGVLSRSPQQSPAVGRAAQPLPELALQPHRVHLEQQPPLQNPTALTHPHFTLHPRGHPFLHHLVPEQGGEGESPASGGPQGGAFEPAWWVGGQQ